MTGARALIQTLVDAGVDVCFANPGTSEMHFVAALDEVPEMRGVLALFEGVATGAADGYARMTGRPAAVLGPAGALAGAAGALRRGGPAGLFLGGRARRERGLVAAARVAAATGAAMICEPFPARLERGAGLPALERLPYFAEMATAK